MLVRLVIVIVLCSSGFWIDFNVLVIIMKFGNVVIIVLKLYFEVVFMVVSIVLLIVVCVLLVNWVIMGCQVSVSIDRMFISSVFIIVQMVLIFCMFCMMGVVLFRIVGMKLCLLLYYCGMFRVNSLLDMNISISGRMVMLVWVSWVLVKGVGLFISVVGLLQFLFVCSVVWWCYFRYVMFIVSMNMLLRMLSIGVVQVLVLKNVVGMMFWICGVFGSVFIVKLKLLMFNVVGIRCLGMLFWWNILVVKGYIVNIIMNSDILLQVSRFDISMIDSIVCCGLNSWIVVLMMECEKLDSLINFLNIVFSRNIGKQSFRKLIILFMNKLVNIGVISEGLVSSIVLSVVMGVNRIMLQLWQVISMRKVSVVSMISNDMWCFQMKRCLVFGFDGCC